MNKLAVIVPFYKRPELTKLCFQRLKRQSKRLGFDVIVCGSEGEESKKLAKGFKYIEEENKLGKKLNALLKACKKYDGVIVIGSDNFMSDSIIELYQNMDFEENTYYAFDDILIYSSRFNKLCSDFEYTRAGNGIGVARLYPKKAIKDMGYKVWDDRRVKGLDKSANDRLKAKGITQKRIPLEGHFLIDVKIQENITAHDIVNTSHKEHSLEEFNKLGDIGKKILELTPNSTERIYKDSVKKIMCKVLVGYNNHKQGDIVQLKPHIYGRLKRNGYVSLLDE